MFAFALQQPRGWLLIIFEEVNWGICTAGVSGMGVSTQANQEGCPEHPQLPPRLCQGLRTAQQHCRHLSFMRERTMQRTNQSAAMQLRATGGGLGR